MVQLRKHLRLKHYDYKTAGYYFITICTSGRQTILADRDEWIQKWLQGVEIKFPGVKLDWRVTMPDHIHFIFILDGESAGLPRIMQWFKAQTTLEMKKNGLKSARLWQPNYYEHVIRDEKALYKIREYIQYNPLMAQIPWKELDP